MDKIISNPISNDFVLLYYNTIKQLIHHKSIYQNMMAETEYRTGSNGKMTDDEKSNLTEAINNVRYFINQSHTYYMSIMYKLNKHIPPELTEITKGFKEQYTPNSEKLERYCFLMLQLLLEETMSDLLKTSQDYISRIYDGRPTETTPKPK